LTSTVDRYSVTLQIHVYCVVIYCSILPLNRAGDMKNAEVYLISSLI